jgi:hypothetical protein
MRIKIQQFITIIKLILFVDVILGTIFLLDYLIEGTSKSFFYLLWVNLYVIFFSCILILFDVPKSKRIYLFLFSLNIILILISYMFDSPLDISKQLTYALIGLNISYGIYIGLKKLLYRDNKILNNVENDRSI